MPDLREEITTSLKDFSQKPLRQAALSLVDTLGYANRIILIFRPDPSAKGVTTSSDGWSMEKKIIFDEPQP